MEHHLLIEVDLIELRAGFRPDTLPLTLKSGSSRPKESRRTEIKAPHSWLEVDRLYATAVELDQCLEFLVILHHIRPVAVGENL